ncbi:MAG TPA: KH domain-containing protein [Candidatus Limnocylindria bacterium]|nr:KH domain-containing protein [Candidatus Limnocylindria bacterium]
MKEFLEYVARGLVDKPDAVWVEVDDEGDETLLTLGVDQEDMGRVIGRDGRIANAIRSLLRVMAARDGRHVELDIVSDAD